MGCDIHLIVEHYEPGSGWRRVPHFDRECDNCDGRGAYENGRECYLCKGAGHAVLRHYDSRDYDVFAMLANVRNGYGFAGTDTGDGFEPLSDGRGLPADLCPEQRAQLEREAQGIGEDYDWDDYGAEWAYDLGEHSHTWLLWNELQDPAYWAKTTRKRGWVGSEQFLVWKEKGSPDSWSGGIGGGRIQHVSNQEMEQRIADRSPALEDYYTLVEWCETYGEAAAFFLERIRAVIEHVGDPDSTHYRLTMGFDS